MELLGNFNLPFFGLGIIYSFIFLVPFINRYRCPGLRDLIQDFWDQKSGMLEISIETDEEILSGICSYLNTGFLPFPEEIPKLFELYHVVQELQIIDLLRVIEQFLELKHRMDPSSTEIVRLAELYGCRNRLNLVANKFPSGSKNTELDTAISESLAEVNSILNLESEAGFVTLSKISCNVELLNRSHSFFQTTLLIGNYVKRIMFSDLK